MIQRRPDLAVSGLWEAVCSSVSVPTHTAVAGAVVGAILIGFIEAIVGAIPFLGQRYVYFAAFSFIILVLIFRPRGIGGLLDATRE